MGIVAGIFSRSGAAPDRRSCEQLRGLMSRVPATPAVAVDDERCFVVTLDPAAAGCVHVTRRPTGSVAVLAGEALLDPPVPGGPAEELAALHEAWDREAWDILKGVNGMFCAVHYDPQRARLTLVGDKLGLRPIYYWIGPEAVVFATAIRILEGLPLVPKRMDLRGVIELCTLGYTLSRRTPYADIAVFRPAEIVQVDARGVDRKEYHRWDRTGPSSAPEDVLVGEVYARFTAAVARRARDDTATAAYLTGGLDSRSVVGALRARGLTVYSLNRSPAGSQDEVLGRMFAEAIGTRHIAQTTSAADDRPFPVAIAAMWADARGRAHPAPERPLKLWSGNGGSLGLGHIYMDRSSVAAWREGRHSAAAATFLRRYGSPVSRRVFRPELVDQLVRVPLEGVLEELAAIECGDRGRAFYLFLMFNDQRRHYSAHFEDFDLHGLEHHVPFYDSAFLASVISVPLDLCLGHRFYMRFLARFDPVVTSTPWQAYPGHEPCPLPVPPSLHYQWGGRLAPAAAAVRRRAVLRRTGQTLAARPYPDPVLRRMAVRGAAWAFRTRLRDTSGALEQAATVAEYWQRCEGRHAPL